MAFKYVVSILNGIKKLINSGAVIWSEHGTGNIKRRAADGHVTTLAALAPPLYDLRLVSDTARIGTTLRTLNCC